LWLSGQISGVDWLPTFWDRESLKPHYACEDGSHSSEKSCEELRISEEKFSFVAGAERQ
jgi:hypothetical protein